MTPVTYGIDVSTHQNEIDWNAVAADGIDFAIIRLGAPGYGQERHPEPRPYSELNINGASAAGLDVGHFFLPGHHGGGGRGGGANFVLQYLRATTSPTRWSLTGRMSPPPPPAPTTLDSATQRSCAVTFCDTIAAAGYQPMVYFNGYLGLLRYDLSAIDDYPFWYAYYNGVHPNLYYDFQMWQYSSSGSRVAGIEGKVDLNICFGGQYGQSHGGTIPSREEESSEPSGAPSRRPAPAGRDGAGRDRSPGGNALLHPWRRPIRPV